MNDRDILIEELTEMMAGCGGSRSSRVVYSAVIALKSAVDLSGMTLDNAKVCEFLGDIAKTSTSLKENIEKHSLQRKETSL